MAYYVLALSPHQFFDDSGLPLAAGRVYTYASGTTTPLTTYKTSAGTAWGAYVQLDSAGRPENGEIYTAQGTAYKWIIQSSAGVVLDTVDPVPSVPPSSVNVDITGTAGQAITIEQLCCISDGSSGTTAGAWYPADADAAFTSTTPVMGFAVSSVGSGETGTFRTDGQIEVAGPLTPGALYYASATAGAITATAPANARLVGQAESTTLLAIALNPPPTATGTITGLIDSRIKDICNGRLTLTTGVPVTTTDVTAAGTLFWCPYIGNEIALYSGTAWVTFAQAQLSIAVPAAANQVYDAFVDYNAGVPALTLTAWTNDTTRATALTTQDGVLVLTGTLGKRYVGTVRTVTASQLNDSVLLRHVWNYYNRLPRELQRLETTPNWTYTTATVRQANGSAANQVDIVVGVAEEPFYLRLKVIVINDTAASVSFGIGEGATTTYVAESGSWSAPIAVTLPLTTDLWKIPAIGRQFYSWNEYSTASGTTTWYGANTVGSLTTAGLSGWIRG